MPYKNPDDKAAWRVLNNWRNKKYAETFKIRHPEPEWKTQKREAKAKAILERNVAREEAKRLRREEINRRRNDPVLVEQRRIKSLEKGRRMAANRRSRDPEYGRRYYWNNRDKNLEKLKAYRERNPEKVAVSNFRASLKSDYRLSVEDYNRILENQKRRCKICLKSFPCDSGWIDTGKKGKGIKVDHCHEAGHVRGLLCATCNLVVGCLRNSEWLAERFRRYLLQEVLFNRNGHESLHILAE